MTSSSSAVTPSSLFRPLLPDEMVWSYFARVVARFPSLSLEGLAGLLGNQLPSHRKTFPTRLGNLAAAFNFAGAPDVGALIRGHTFFPFAEPEISASKGAALIESLTVDSFHHGAPDTLVLPGDFSLRVCPTCMIQDGKDAVPYWHRCHQVPGLRICTKHFTALVETDIPAGTAEPTAVSAAVAGMPLAVSDMAAQTALAAAYGFLAMTETIANGDQVRHELVQTLGRHGFYSSRQVALELTGLLRGVFHPDTLVTFRLAEHAMGIRDWISVPKVALVLAALGESYEEFIKRAATAHVPARSTIRSEASAAREIELATRVNDLASEAVALIKREFPFRRVTRWALANQLKSSLGGNFASKWSFRGRIRAELDKHVESDLCFATRATDAIVARPELCAKFQAFEAFLGGAGVARVMREHRNLARIARAVFNEAHGRGGIDGKSPAVPAPLAAA